MFRPYVGYIEDDRPYVKCSGHMLSVQVMDNATIRLLKGFIILAFIKRIIG